MTDSPECDSETAAGEMMDLDHLRDLLALLRDSGVVSFQAGGMTVVFRDDPGLSPAAAAKTVVDDGHGTSNRPVAGFKDGFKHPSLWAAQNGKTLKFDGTLE